ncbi:FliI/YscN family ATPase [Sandaracinobacteroides saxicola]|uniref:FliI/YscN family ATPase n=1 Tax=Sandaracinobacteroides saxicola TaxID=2759707 RepID=A0A7G5IFW8_9SPHN|nr:FliI/YscN family ATPase [Sandaracinobacteroides saxicola]QMW22260.1 FliI/YscN family ATPase [Sandaracinobacteroides saxicola]
MTPLDIIADACRRSPRSVREGRLVGVTAQGATASGLGRLPIGSRVRIVAPLQDGLLADIVGSDSAGTRLACLGSTDGLAPGGRITAEPAASLHPHPNWRGRILDAFGQALDGLGPLAHGSRACPLRRPAPDAAVRRGFGPRLSTGIHAIDLFAPLCEGQRIGIFAGSGVGKSVLMNMIADRTPADAIVVGLIGERGRELRAFIDAMTPQTRSRTTIVIATSDSAAAVRREAAYAATAVAEGFAAQGMVTLLLMDSITRFAMAGREIGLAAGEPPAVRGFPPSVFAELPRLLERTGPATESAAPITAIYTVLVDGGDHDEPVADAVRGILDGHLVLSRAIAERGRLPAIDVLRSVSRSLPEAHGDDELTLMREARGLLSDMADVEAVVRLGAYERGSNARTDRAIALAPRIESFLTQSPRQPFERLPFAALTDLLKEQPKDD